MEFLSLIKHMENKALKIVQNASKNLSQEHFIGAVITDRKGRILSAGCNSYNKTHPRQVYYAEMVGKQHKIYLHAELDAIIKLNHVQEKPYTIYIARVNKKGQPVCSKPCEICQMAIKDAGIKNVIYT